MVVLVLYRSSRDFPLIGPFKTADMAIRHLRSLTLRGDEDWRIASILPPVKAKKARKAKRRARK